MSHDTPRRRDDGPNGPDADGAHDDVAWLAWRYLLDELDPAEAAAFTERLGTDEEAAVALSRGVVLLSAIDGAAQPGRRIEPPLREGRRRRLVTGLAALAATVGLVCLLGIGRWLEQAGPASDAIELVSIWRESGGDAVVESESVGLDDDAPPTSDDVPDWLMAAVALDAPAADDEILEN
jgi:hypothetical protein